MINSHETKAGVSRSILNDSFSEIPDPFDVKKVYSNFKKLDMTKSSTNQLPPDGKIHNYSMRPKSFVDDYDNCSHEVIVSSMTGGHTTESYSESKTPVFETERDNQTHKDLLSLLDIYTHRDGSSQNGHFGRHHTLFNSCVSLYKKHPGMNIYLI